MKVYELLDANEQRQIEIIQTLLGYRGKATIRELAENLGVYRNTVKEDLASLSAVLAEYFEAVSLINTEGSVILKTDGTITSTDIGYLFLQRSINYNILVYLFENGHFDQATMAWHLGISEATLSRRLRKLNMLLAEFSLKIRNGKLMGSEMQIRHFYFSLFWYGRPYDLNEKEKLDDLGMEFIHTLESYLGIPFTDEGKIKMKLYLTIIVQRLTLFSHQIKTYLEPGIEYDFNDSFYLALKQILLDYGDRFPFELDEDESKIFYLFIVANFSLDMDNARTRELINEGKEQGYFVVELSELVFQRVEEQIDVSKLSPNFMKNLKYLLFNIHVNSYYFHGQIAYINANSINELLYEFPDPLLFDFAKEWAEWVVDLMGTSEYERASKQEYLFEYYAALVYLGYRDLDVKLVIGCDFPFERNIAYVFVDHLANHIDPRIKVELYPYEKEQEYDLIITNIHKSYPNIDPDRVLILFSLETKFDIENVECFVSKYYRKKLEKLMK